MKIHELIAQDEVSLATGSHLIVNTRPEGYVPTFKESVAIANGQYLYRLVGVGEADAETGLHASRAVVQLLQNDNLDGFKEDVGNPIILVGDGKLTFMTGRNDRIAKDGYHDRQYHVIDLEGKETDREILAAFVEFARTEFSMGVNDFQVEGPDYVAE